MAITRPLKWDTASAALKQMTDAELELVAYQLRKAWATDLSGTYTGACDRSGGATATNGFGACYRGDNDSPTASGVTHLAFLQDKIQIELKQAEADKKAAIDAALVNFAAAEALDQCIRILSVRSSVLAWF